MRKGKPAQHDRVHDRELRHRAADAEREHEDGEKEKGPVLEKNAETDPKVLGEGIKYHEVLFELPSTTKPSRSWMMRLP